MRKKTELSLAVQYACNDEHLPSRPQVRRWVLAALEQSVQATIRFVDADEGQTLNRNYRGKDYATNVLTFIYGTEPVVSGDLIICLPVVLREAADQNKPVKAHLAHLIVHGMLHLQGYDHETGKREAARMENKERDILARFGIPDPYQ
jgi:probable rRNA maturation factor